MYRYFIEIQLKDYDFNIGWYMNAKSREDVIPENLFVLPDPDKPDYNGHTYNIELVTVEPTE